MLKCALHVVERIRVIPMQDNRRRLSETIADRERRRNEIFAIPKPPLDLADALSYHTRLIAFAHLCVK